jgi:lipoprotein-anchoring transpeptidase ErfK/SrfK
VQDDAYVHAAEVRLPQRPSQVFPGRWLDVELTTPAMVTAYEDDRPVASLLAIKGRDAEDTPQGTYKILRRVYDETMDSETLGVPRDDPRGYYLEHVLYTQYFTEDGDSLHYNWWSTDLGAEGSRGCLGLGLNDAQWLWDWADVGTVINIHG